ncbi:MAG TPA: hypothetical protein VFI90_15695, partial [Rubrobacter sp.]|nr:hypothetical protein [Rubrobacter sp.]
DGSIRYRVRSPSAKFALTVFSEVAAYGPWLRSPLFSLQHINECWSVPVRPGDLNARERGLRDRGRLQARDPRQGWGGAGGCGEAEVLALAAALERRPEHPLAHAILTAVDGAELHPVSGFR